MRRVWKLLGERSCLGNVGEMNPDFNSGHHSSMVACEEAKEPIRKTEDRQHLKSWMFPYGNSVIMILFYCYLFFVLQNFNLLSVYINLLFPKPEQIILSSEIQEREVILSDFRFNTI